MKNIIPTELNQISGFEKASQQLQNDMEKALRVQKQMRKDAPKNISIRTAYVCPRETQARRLVPDAFWRGKPTSERGQGRKGSIPPTMSTFYDRPDRHKQNIAKGYVPVLEDSEHAQQGGDLLYMRPIEFQKMELAQASHESQRRVESMDQEAKDDGLLQNQTETVVQTLTGDEADQELNNK